MGSIPTRPTVQKATHRRWGVGDEGVARRREWGGGSLLSPDARDVYVGSAVIPRSLSFRHKATATNGQLPNGGCHVVICASTRTTFDNVTTNRPRKFSNEALLDALARGPVSTGELARTFGVTRQAVLNRLKGLEISGLATRTGDRRGSRWQAPPARRFSWSIEVGTSDEDLMWTEAWNACRDLVADVNDQTRSVLRYCATEMLNNSIDHSDGTVVTLDVVVVEDDISLRISDDGVGAFPKVRDHFDLPSLHEAVARLTKGRQTTAPDAHSGQGLFFTSKVVDQFEIASAGVAWSVDNVRNDQALLEVEQRPGTQVLLRTRREGSVVLKDIFDRFAGEDYEFDRATFRVVLGDISDEFVSRSEAKRLGAGLEVYRRVELDFTGVSGVGQGFVDELFRVWSSAHPDTELVRINANDAVTFMIERGLGG